MITRRAFLSSLAVTAAGSVLHANVNANWFSKLYHIGIADSLVRSHAQGDEAAQLNQSMTQVFETPGQPKCQFEFASTLSLAERLRQSQIHLMVCPGIEYAWMKSKFPDLLPLVVAQRNDIRMKACVVVRNESKARKISDLRNASISLPERLPQHAYLFINQKIASQGAESAGFFQQSLLPADSNEGIESVIEEKADAILLDQDAWLGYQEQKSARSKKLRVLEESISFPTAVVLHHRETWNKLEIPLLRVALCAAHQKPLARQILNYWGVSRFVTSKTEYQQIVEDFLCEMPEPIKLADIVAKSTK
ncbi:MAG: PhnD/SsuA/transferrin family substrate-binding protein [Gemmatales bacterium]